MLKSNKKLKIALGLVALIALIRITLPVVSKYALNNYLDKFSPSITAHISDVDLAIIRGSYTLKGVTAATKKDKKEFLSINRINASLSWKELVQGLVSSNILIEKLKLDLNQSLLPALKEHLASLEKTETEKESQILIPRIDLIDSSITSQERVLLTDLSARVSNATPSKNAPLSPFNVKGKLLGPGQLKIEGEMNLYGEKPEWTVDSEILKFDMTALNKFLKQKLPLTFTKGELDLYGEAKSEGGHIKGYLKPFIKGLDVIKSDEKMEGPKHWLFEIISALGNTTLKADEVMATRIPFTFDKKFEIEGGETITKAIAHGFLQKQSRGIENSIQLKEAQEEK